MSARNANRREYATDAATLIDGVADRRGVSLYRMAEEVGCDHSYISRLRAGTRQPTREWLERFIVKCQFTKEEAIRAYELYRYIPPGYRVVPARDAA